MAPINNIIFDFDGTLVDTAPLIVRTMQETIRELKLPERCEKDCKATIGLRLEDVPSVLWPDMKDMGPIFAQKYRELFDILKRPLSVQCFSGVIQTLQLLRSEGVGMAIASSRSHKSLDEYVEQFGLHDCFGMLIGGDDVAHGKPAPDPVLTILKGLSWKAEETLTVGDAPVDIQMGRAAGTRTCAVSYGNGTEQELEAALPDYIISEFPTLTELIDH